jgi:hypothetical protein
MLTLIFLINSEEKNGIYSTVLFFIWRKIKGSPKEAKVTNDRQKASKNPSFVIYFIHRRCILQNQIATKEEMLKSWVSGTHSPGQSKPWLCV